MMTVKEVSEKLEMSPHTVRFYCDSNLIPNIKRDKNNIRQFDEEAVAWLFVVKYLRDCGMSIEAIKEYIDLCLVGNSTIPKRLDIVKQQREVIEQQLNKMKICAEYLDDKLNLYQQAIDSNLDVEVTTFNQWEKVLTQQKHK
ncbi:MerR family transcriptional regulator [Pediococcus argentinicus]|uniref:HTH merR-type domain-containing protein n=1 Tax=Pediococcus argentinicus TaxID=480391 RepID=A0A0R2NK02_9LACO|nr:MerR family transcriptional regulator [Pediococcus argentinicus]KRO26068.1 hypothetical protein IV88_GL000983 [Pediococcus argentinicus]NKZ21730.1 MerR family transcriptional regulator [Pediococcus argentinicus]GEP18893.1 MerR family transcriptional regulator [Pediococcus argentinicus]